jgi:hypothetical protein
MDIDVHVPAELVVLAEQTGVIAFVDRRLQRFAFADDIRRARRCRRMRAHGEARDHAAFDQRMRIVAHDVAVLAGTGLGFVGIDHEIMRPAVAFLRHEGPFQTGREACAATAAKAGSLHLVDDPVAALFQDLLGAIPVATAIAPLSDLSLRP